MSHNNLKKFKRNIISTIIIYVLMLAGLLIYGGFQGARISKLQDGGLRKLYAYDFYSVTSPATKGHRSSTTNYVRFSTTIDEKSYTLSISTNALGKDNDKVFGLNSDKCIERYVLYSDDLTMAFDENVTKKEYARRELITWLLINFAVLMLMFIPLLTHYLFLRKARPGFKGNTHTRKEASLIHWYGDSHTSHVVIDWTALIAIFLMIITWTLCDAEDAWLRFAVIGIFSPLLFMPLLFIVIKIFL